MSGPDQRGRAGRLTTYAHDGLSFDVLDQGPLDGTPVLLLHGFPERATCWRTVAPLLHVHDLRTYAPDQRGYSPGARPPRRRDYRLAHLVADAVALVEEIGTPVHLVGHDWGAVVAWTLAAQRPDLVRTLTAFSVPHPKAFLGAMLTSGQGLKSWYMGFFQLPRVPELAARKPGGVMDGFLRRAGMTRAEVARFRREIVADGALPYALGWYRALPMADLAGSAGRVRVPTTFVWSDGDVAIAGAGARRTSESCTGSYEYVELAGVTHWIPTQAPDACAEAILERVVGAGAP